MQLKKVEKSDLKLNRYLSTNSKAKWYNERLDRWKPIDQCSVLVLQIYTNKEDVGFATDKDTIPLDRYLHISSKSAKSFAERNGFDYRLVERDYISPFKVFQSSNFLKYESIKYLKDYDVVLYVDTDTIIGYNVENFLEYYNGWANVVLKTRLGLIEERDCLVSKLFASHINSGVMILNRFSVIWHIHHDTFSKLEKFSEYINLEMIPKYVSGHYNDETFFKHFLIYSEIPYINLADRFNLNYVHANGDEDMNRSIIHYTGKWKTKMLKRSI